MKKTTFLWISTAEDEPIQLVNANQIVRVIPGKGDVRLFLSDGSKLNLTGPESKKILGLITDHSVGGDGKKPKALVNTVRNKLNQSTPKKSGARNPKA